MAKLIVNTLGVTLFASYELRPAEHIALIRYAHNLHICPTIERILPRLRALIAHNPHHIFDAIEFQTLALHARIDAQYTQWNVPGIRYLFVVPQTPLGQFMREMCQRAVEYTCPQLRYEFVCVAGLQLTNAAGLDDALRELTMRLDDVCSAYPRFDVVCNTSGGMGYLSGAIQSYANARGYPTIYSCDGTNLIMTKPELPGQFPPRLVYI